MERVAFLLDSTGERIECMLNPETVEVRRLTGVRRHTTASGHLVGAGHSDDPLLFTGGGRTEIDVDLLFSLDLLDTQAAPEDVRTLTRPLWLLAENTEEERGGLRPPVVRLVWGKTWNVPVVLVAVAERFDDFDAQGVPRRSWLRVKLVRVAEAPPAAGYRSGPTTLAAPAAASAGSTSDTGGTSGIGRAGSASGSSGTGTRVSGPKVAAIQAVGDGWADEEFGGVRPDLLATTALGSPLRWRDLLAHNNIDNPLQVAAGAVLTVPDEGQEAQG